ncbi:MAG: hypothetical protein KIT48_08985 [Pseudolabrys sp.]|nr:hypothetical protein [Pseudolabrys sp.]
MRHAKCSFSLHRLFDDTPFNTRRAPADFLLRTILSVAGKFVFLRVISASGLLIALWFFPVQLFVQVGIYTTLLGLASICVFGRYEFLILRASTNDERIDASHLSILVSTCAIAMAFACGFVLWRDPAKLAIIVFPAALLARAWLRLGLTFATANGRYENAVDALIPHALAQPAILVILLHKGFEPFAAFLISDMVGQFVAAFCVAISERECFAHVWRPLARERIFKLALSNWSLPTTNLTSASSAFLFAAAPIFLLPTIPNGILAGTLALLFRILDLPTSLTASSVGPIMIKEVTDRRRDKNRFLKGATFLIPTAIAVAVFGSISVGAIVLDRFHLTPQWHLALTILPGVALFQASIAATGPLIDIATAAGKQNALVLLNLLAAAAGGTILIGWCSEPLMAIAAVGIIGATRAITMSAWLAFSPCDDELGRVVPS